MIKTPKPKKSTIFGIKFVEADKWKAPDYSKLTSVRSLCSAVDKLPLDDEQAKEHVQAILDQAKTISKRTLKSVAGTIQGHLSNYCGAGISADKKSLTTAAKSAAEAAYKVAKESWDSCCRQERAEREGQQTSKL